MRNFKNVSLTKQKALSEAFPELLNFYVCTEVADYKQVSVSVFDHWLSQEEAIKRIDNSSSIQCDNNNELLHKFIVSLAQSTETYVVKLRGRNTDKKATFREFTSHSGMVNSLIPKHHFSADTHRFVLVLPQLNLVYFESSDFTHHIYFKREEDLESVSKLANENGLSIIK